MTRHKLILALITAGLVLAATSAAFNLSPSRWFSEDSAAEAQLQGKSAASPVPPPALTIEAQPEQLGLALRPLTREEQASAGIQGGLLVQSVAGAAARANLMPGDVLLAVNAAPLKSTDQLRSAMEAKPRVVAFLVLRDSERIYVPVALK